MIAKHLNRLSHYFRKSEQGQHNLTKFRQMMDQPGWPVFVDSMIYLKGCILEELLSDRYTGLEPIEKDVQQRAYADIVKVLDYFADPLAKARSQDAIALHNSKMEATVKGATSKEKK